MMDCVENKLSHTINSIPFFLAQHCSSLHKNVLLSLNFQFEIKNQNQIIDKKLMEKVFLLNVKLF
jgi:hypothetical protein